MTAQTLNLDLEREFNASAGSVFNAIKDGVLFLQCGAVKNSMKIDFREGGSYYLSFGPDGEIAGNFTKIVPNELIAFTWGNGTHVSISIEARGNSTLVKLTHFDIPNLEWLDAYRGGWEDGICGLKSAMEV